MLKKRKKINSKLFEHDSNLQSMFIEMLEGIHEIKINSIEKEIRWRWRSVQSKHDAVYHKWVNLQQVQQVGNDTINQLKNILITFYSVILVIQGEVSLGMMMAIQFIIGQLNAPISQFNLITILQDILVALERLSSVHLAKNEDEKTKNKVEPEHQRFNLTNVAFCYEGSNLKPILDNINIVIPEKSITAIVGSSGSGKTTLLKLLLKFYEPSKGIIEYGNQNINHFTHSFFRSKCGVVLQDGYLFADTIEKNICLKEEKINQKRFVEVTKIACVDEFINDFEDGYTKGRY